MAKIPLRAYIRTIDDLIETHQYNEAILQGNNILSTYPKHIDTYRLLGKAMLESRQNDNAAVLFNCILNVFPDDFIANLGLSYIEETKQNIEKSVDHMERAFELQPANSSIQEELKRLYRQRDGIEPNRIRLTRGALIKMYARSNLHQQAIGEARVALHEHPDRTDFEIVLAKMLALAGNTIDAVESCLLILSKLPYCFDANLILFQILPESSEKYDITTFHSRLMEIDPYYKYVSKHRPDVFSIPEIAVTVEELPDVPSESTESIDTLQWEKFITEIWAQKKTIEFSQDSDNEIKWDDVLSKHADVIPESKPQIHSELKTESDKETGFERGSDGNTERYHTKEKDISPIVDESLNDLPDESGIVDHDAPVVNSNQDEDLPSPIWIQETGIDRSEKENDNLFSKLENANEKKNTDDLKTEHYFDVVLKDAHDALLSGFPERALEGYRQLLQENQIIERATEQLTHDLNAFPDNFNLWVVLGDAFQRLGMATNALDAYQNAEKYLGNKG